jgi:hypothetical protein
MDLTLIQYEGYNLQVSVWIHSDRQKKRGLNKELMKTDIPEGWTSLDGLYPAASAAANDNDD